MLAVADLSESSTITLSAAGGIVVAIFGAAAWLHNLVTKVEASLEAIAVRLKALEDSKPGNYTLAGAAEHALRMAIENPGMRVPDPRDPSKIIVVQGHTCDEG